MCDNPNHDHDNLLDVIKYEINTPEEIASITIQIFCAMSSALVQAEMPNPVIHSGFEPIKLLADKLGDQELTDIVITSEMEHAEAISKMFSKVIHPSNRKARKGKKD